MVSFDRDTLTARVLYRRKGGPDSGTNARGREVTEITRTGLQRVLAAVEGCVDVVGTTGYEVREDTICADVAKAPLKAGAA